MGMLDFLSGDGEEGGGLFDFDNTMDWVTGGTYGMVMDKYSMDQNQKAAREAAEKNRDISIEMFNMQKANNLEQWEREKAYNLDLWNRHNEYNTPAAQMARLKSAGLNPRLMYPQGNVGNASAPVSAKLDTADVDTPKMETSRGDFGNRMTPMDYFAIKQSGLVNQNLSAQNSLISAQARATNATADTTERENKLLSGTGASNRDGAFVRYGGRALKWLRGVDWDGSNKRIQFWQPGDGFIVPHQKK